jgi:hypothetical protein
MNAPPSVTKLLLQDTLGSSLLVAVLEARPAVRPWIWCQKPGILLRSFFHRWFLPQWLPGLDSPTHVLFEASPLVLHSSIPLEAQQQWTHHSDRIRNCLFQASSHPLRVSNNRRCSSRRFNHSRLRLSVLPRFLAEGVLLLRSHSPHVTSFRLPRDPTHLPWSFLLQCRLHF